MQRGGGVRWLPVGDLAGEVGCRQAGVGGSGVCGLEPLDLGLDLGTDPVTDDVDEREADAERFCDLGGGPALDHEEVENLEVFGFGAAFDAFEGQGGQVRFPFPFPKRVEVDRGGVG